MKEIHLDNLRHSCAHLMAAAVLQLWPGTKNAIGPSIENGFYYDFDFGDKKISETDFVRIEQKMHELSKAWLSFERHEVDKDQALKEFAGNPYKKELIEEFSSDNQQLTIYQSGNFRDLCRGGHVENPKKELRHLKLLSVAGAYWRGNEKNKMLTRIYATCFPTKEELDQFLIQQGEAKKHDHRKLGVDLDLFSISPLTGQGLILWHPKLAIARDIVEQLWKRKHYQEGYQLVYTPHIASMDMFVKSRHLTKYVNSMFPVMLHQNIEGESAPDYQVDEVLKPMNCPNHIQIYKSRPRSYRELPLRIGELGTVYRYERAGVLHGMTRVRGFTQDDSHIFCTPERVIDEVKRVLRLTQYFYNLFGFKEYQAYVATRPEKYLGTLEMWEFSQNALKKALEDEGIPYKIDEGEGVFYGPKIDSKIKDSLGREWQLGTVQFDFNQPTKAETTDEEIEEFWKLKTFQQKFKTKETMATYLRRMGRGFDVTYITPEGKEKHTVMIHRTILGSMERFFGILIEHYGGVFPAWLAPTQIVLIPIADRHSEVAQNAATLLRNHMVRVQVDDRSESMQAKIRDATLQKIPYMGIIGDKEVKDGSCRELTVRTREGKNIGTLAVEEFLHRLQQEIEHAL